MMAFVFFGGVIGRPDVVDSWTWLPAMPPTLAIAMAMVLRSAYRNLDGPSLRRAVVDAAAAVASALLSQAVMAIVNPQWLLGSLALLGGSVGTFVTVFVLRSSVPSENDFGAPVATNGTISIDELMRDVQRFERRIDQRNRLEVLAGHFVVIGFGLFLW